MCLTHGLINSCLLCSLYSSLVHLICRAAGREHRRTEGRRRLLSCITDGHLRREPQACKSPPGRGMTAQARGFTPRPLGLHLPGSTGSPWIRKSHSQSGFPTAAEPHLGTCWRCFQPVAGLPRQKVRLLMHPPLAAHCLPLVGPPAETGYCIS